jgi:hypothetical protein
MLISAFCFLSLRQPECGTREFTVAHYPRPTQALHQAVLKLPTASTETEKGRRVAGLQSLNCDAVVVIHRTGSRGVGPVPSVVITIFWRAFELILRYSGAITTQVGVVLQRLPG